MRRLFGTAIWGSKILLITAVLFSCSQVEQVCTDELTVRWSPHDTTVSVGQSFVPSVRLTTCGGRQELTDTFTWNSSDPLILEVEPATGRATAKNAGSAVMSVTGEKYGLLIGVSVTVR